jgi:hypothetical protein
MKKAAAFVSLTISLCALSAPTGGLLPDEKNNVEVYQKVAGAVVNITAITLRNDFEEEVVPQKGQGHGRSCGRGSGARCLRPSHCPEE